MLLKDINVNDKKFSEYSSVPLISGDVCAYRIILSTDFNLSGCRVSVNAKRPDGRIITDMGECNKNLALYIINSTMYDIAGEISVRISVISNDGSTVTNKEIIFNALESFGIGDVCDKDGNSIADIFTRHINNKNNPHNVTPEQIGLGNVISDIENLNKFKLSYTITDSLPQNAYLGKDCIYFIKYKKENYDAVDNPAAIGYKVYLSTNNGSSYIWNEMNDIEDLSISTQKLANYSVTSLKIANNAVTNSKIADNSVSSSKIQNSAVSTQQLEDGSVTVNKLHDSSVISAKIANGAVTNIKIAGSAVTDSKIADRAVTTSKIDDGAVTNIKIADNAVFKNKLSSELQNKIDDMDNDIDLTKNGTILPDVSLESIRHGDNYVFSQKENEIFIIKNDLKDGNTRNINYLQYNDKCGWILSETLKHGRTYKVKIIKNPTVGAAYKNGQIDVLYEFADIKDDKPIYSIFSDVNRLVNILYNTLLSHESYIKNYFNDELNAYKSYIGKMFSGINQNITYIYDFVGMDIYDGGIFGMVQNGNELDGGLFEENQSEKSVDCGEF